MAEALRKFLGCKEHLDWFKKDLNTAKIITLQNHKHIHKKNLNGRSICYVKANSQAGNIKVFLMTTQKDQGCKIFS